MALNHICVLQDVPSLLSGLQQYTDRQRAVIEAQQQEIADLQQQLQRYAGLCPGRCSCLPPPCHADPALASLTAPSASRTIDVLFQGAAIPAAQLAMQQVQQRLAAAGVQLQSLCSYVEGSPVLTFRRLKSRLAPDEAQQLLNGGPMHRLPLLK